jgi:hypothetical protein
MKKELRISYIHYRHLPDRLCCFSLNLLPHYPPITSIRFVITAEVATVSLTSAITSNVDTAAGPFSFTVVALG